MLVHPSLLDDGTATDLITGELLSSQDIEDRLDAMWDFYMETNDEDIVACESVQQGVQIEQYMGKVLKILNFKISKNEKKIKKEEQVQTLSDLPQVFICTPPFFLFN